MGAASERLIALTRVIGASVHGVGVRARPHQEALGDQRANTIKVAQGVVDLEPRGSRVVFINGREHQTPLQILMTFQVKVARMIFVVQAEQDASADGVERRPSLRLDRLGEALEVASNSIGHENIASIEDGKDLGVDRVDQLLIKRNRLGQRRRRVPLEFDQDKNR